MVVSIRKTIGYGVTVPTHAKEQYFNEEALSRVGYLTGEDYESFLTAKHGKLDGDELKRILQGDDEKLKQLGDDYFHSDLFALDNLSKILQPVTDSITVEEDTDSLETHIIFTPLTKLDEWNQANNVFDYYEVILSQDVRHYKQSPVMQFFNSSVLPSEGDYVNRRTGEPVDTKKYRAALKFGQSPVGKTNLRLGLAYLNSLLEELGVKTLSEIIPSKETLSLEASMVGVMGEKASALYNDVFPSTPPSVRDIVEFSEVLTEKALSELRPGLLTYWN